MAIEAPLSNFKKHNLKIGILICIGVGIWFAYDGYFNQKFMEKNTEDGVYNDSLKFNRTAPYFLAAGAIVCAGCLLMTKDQKIIADESEIVINGKKRITYDSIEKIDKTHFDSKGYFIVTYKDANNSESSFKFSDRKYDNLAAILEHLVAKIS